MSAESDTNNILDVDEQKPVDFKRKIRQAKESEDYTETSMSGSQPRSFFHCSNCLRIKELFSLQQKKKHEAHGRNNRLQYKGNGRM